MICPPEHKHGITGTCYVSHKCRCQNCRDGRATYARKLKRRHLYGRFDNGLVDIQPVREHVKALQAYGVGWKRIAELAGVGKTSVAQIIYGRKGSAKDPRKGEELKRIKRETAEKILAVKKSLNTMRAGALVPSTGFTRRVQALVWNGWSLSKIAGLLGVDVTNFSTMLGRDRVTVRYDQLMREVFSELWDQMPPNKEWRDLIAFNRSRSMARQRGWVSALAWDDIDEDPEPEGVGASSEVDRELIERAWADQMSDSSIAKLVGCTARTVLRIRGELGLQAWPKSVLRAA